MKNILLIIILLTSATLSAQQKISSIKLSLTGCKGKCAVYTVELYREGIVNWNGIKNVNRKGFYTAKLSKKEMTALFAEFEKNNFTKFRKKYVPAGEIHFDLDIEIAGDLISVANAEGGPVSLQRIRNRVDEKIKNLKWKPLRFTPPIIKPETDQPPLQEMNMTTVESGEINGAEAEPISEPQIKMLENDVLTYAEEMPEFPGGMSALARFMQTNIKYPEMAREMGISGKVYCRFVVDEMGNIGDVKVLRGVGHGLDQEAVRVIKMMPHWIPGKMNKKPVKVQYTLPVMFVLK